MARYILDTGVAFGYLRSSPYAAYIDRQYSPFTVSNISVISLVTNAELRSLALQLHWGTQKQQNLTDLLGKVYQVDVNRENILQQYAEIDAFSQGKHPVKRLPAGLTARNMGKNDLWIAATASVINATLITTDKDFDHLNGLFFTVIYVDPKTKP
jgi:predicted nucleic acid-binding protein